MVNKLTRTELWTSTARLTQLAQKQKTQMALFIKLVTTLPAHTSCTPMAGKKINVAPTLAYPTSIRNQELCMKAAQNLAARRPIMSTVQLLKNAHGLPTPSASHILTCV